MDISFVIVSFNTKKILQSSLNSLNESISNSLIHEIIVVDNNSQDGTILMLEENYPEIKIIKINKNIGYTSAMNMGLQAASGDYLVQLNPDVIIEQGSFEKLFGWMNLNSQVGICTPKVVNRDGTLQKQCRRSFAKPWDVITYFMGLDRLFPESRLFGRYLLTYLKEDQISEVDAVSGSCMFIRKKVIDQIGFLDARFFAYQEDADFCFRAKQAGWKIVYLPITQVIHFGGQGGSKNEPYKAIKAWHRSYYLYYRKNLAKDTFFLVNWFMYLAMGIKLILSLIGAMFQKDKVVGTRKP
jgi:hypothetical protein